MIEPQLRLKPAEYPQAGTRPRRTSSLHPPATPGSGAARPWGFARKPCSPPLGGSCPTFVRPDPPAAPDRSGRWSAPARTRPRRTRRVRRRRGRAPATRSATVGGAHATTDAVGGASPRGRLPGSGPVCRRAPSSGTAQASRGTLRRSSRPAARVAVPSGGIDRRRHRVRRRRDGVCRRIILRRRIGLRRERGDMTGRLKVDPVERVGHHDDLGHRVLRTRRIGA